VKKNTSSSKLEEEYSQLVEKYGRYKNETKSTSSAKKMWNELNPDANKLLGRIENAIARAKNSEEIKDLKKKRTRIEEINGELHTDMDLYLSREETTSERNLSLMQRYLDLTKKDPISFAENSKTMTTLFAMYSKDFSKEDLEKAYKIMDELTEISRKLRK
jgi:hypothetical protein